MAGRMSTRGETAAVLVAVLAAVSAIRAAAAPVAPALIPAPKSLALDAGTIEITPTNRVLFADDSLEPLARILCDDIARIHGVKLARARSGVGGTGDIVLRLAGPGAHEGVDAYTIVADDTVTLSAGRYADVALGMMTIVQALQPAGDGLSLPRMRIEDRADRAFRGLQVSIRGGYHPPQWVKRVIDAMRFYKVRILQLHTTEALWVGSVMGSTDGADANTLRRHAAWSKREMDDVIDYARERGVFLVPHNEMRPNDPLWKAALTEDFNPGDAFAGFPDEVDGQGKFEMGKLDQDERFWNFVKVASQRSYDQFARSWPDGKLPYYHIGPVYGEGGCNGKQAVRMLGYLMEKNPAIRMMYWNGPGDQDPDLSPHKDNLVVQFYSVHWGGTPEGLLGAGFQLLNVSWKPLYVQPGTRTKALKQGKWIFDEFQLGRFCDEGVVGRPLKNVRDGSRWQENVIGGVLATWDFAGPRDRQGHLEMLTPCIPHFAEHVWNVRPWPYAAGAWEPAAAAAARLAPLVNRVVMEDRPPAAPGGVTATQGVLPGSVVVSWSESDNYPDFYEVCRADSPDPAKAVPISGRIPASFVMQLNTHRDDAVEAGRKYSYWVRGVNAVGASELAKPVEGFTGDGVTLPETYEGFDYEPGKSLESLAGGTGFKDAWTVKTSNVPVTIIADGLTYPGLRTSGKSARFEILHDESEGRNPTHTSVLRHLACPYGRPGTEVWTSFLIRPIKNTYATSVAYHRITAGKDYGSYAIAGVPAEDGKTYLVVTRSNFQNGPDLLTVWVNPTPGRKPPDSEATVMNRQEDNGESDLLTVDVAAYIRGGNDIDELRMGPTYESVTPVAK